MRYQAEARKRRRQQALEEQRRKEQMWEYIGWFFAATIVFAGFVCMFLWLKWLRDGVLW
jgi:hypothetical protein